MVVGQESTVRSDTDANDCEWEDIILFSDDDDDDDVSLELEDDFLLMLTPLPLLFELFAISSSTPIPIFISDRVRRDADVVCRRSRCIKSS